MSLASPTNPPLFEHALCGRCGGSGSFSFNLMHGTRCFGCGGCGFKLTKRGRAAQAFLIDMRKVPLGDLKVGDRVLWDMVNFRVFAPVETIEVTVSGSLDVSGTDAKGRRVGVIADPACRIMKSFGPEEKRAQVERALAFQSTLTARGTPSKRSL